MGGVPKAAPPISGSPPDCTGEMFGSMITELDAAHARVTFGAIALGSFPYTVRGKEHLTTHRAHARRTDGSTESFDPE